ncbi:MAG: hypothetical protein ACPGUV_01160 [Polyangiales bacterium]
MITRKENRKAAQWPMPDLALSAQKDNVQLAYKKNLADNGSGRAAIDEIV